MSVPSYIHSFPYPAKFPQFITSFTLLQIPSNPFPHFSYIVPPLSNLGSIKLFAFLLPEPWLHTVLENILKPHVLVKKNPSLWPIGLVISYFECRCPASFCLCCSLRQVPSSFRSQLRCEFLTSLVNLLSHDIPHYFMCSRL